MSASMPAWISVLAAHQQQMQQMRESDSASAAEFNEQLVFKCTCVIFNLQPCLCGISTSSREDMRPFSR
jgi:hypothetical protein